MGLFSEALFSRLVAAGLVADDAVWSERDVLGAWLSRQGISEYAAAPLLCAYFGVPYRALERGERVHRLPALEAASDWPLYRLAAEAGCVCLRPPNEAERQAYAASPYGEQPLYLTDAVSVHSALLCSHGDRQDVSAPNGERMYRLDDWLRQESTHVDSIIGQIVADALAACATDIHLYVQGRVLRVVFRVAGCLATYAELPLALADGVMNKLKLMAEMDIAEHRLPQDGHFTLSTGEERVHLRLVTLPLYYNEKIVIRILPEHRGEASFEALGFSAENAAHLRALLHVEQGLLLITGPTNSGKTTTLYACLRQLVQQDAMVYSIEDPIEAMVPEVQQMQVNARSGFTFAKGLRGMLRSDPDVLAVGELRDAETVAIAAQAALSGQLVLATLHAADAHQAVNRLRDLGLSDLLIAAVLLAVVNQRLVPLVCRACGGSGVDAKGIMCRFCMGSGRAGRTGVQEIWRLNDAERALIESGVNSLALRQQAQAQGFRSRREDALAKGLDAHGRVWA